MNSNVSLRITVLRLPLVTGIVFIHSAANTLHFADGTGGVEHVSLIVTLIQCFISEVLANLSVPFFFVIAAFLLYQHYELNSGIIAKKWRARMKSLLLPYLIWNSLAIFIYFILQSLPATAQFFSGATTPVSKYGVFDYFNAYLGIHLSANSPIVYQFWFIRDLMLLVLFSPLIWLGIRYQPTLILIAVSALWISRTDIVLANVSSTALFFFISGATLAISGFDLSKMDRYCNAIGGGYLLLALVTSVLLVGNWQYAAYLNKFIVIPGILCVWCIAGKIIKHSRMTAVLTGLSSSSFFIFAAHEPFLLGGIRKLLYRYAPPGDSLAVLMYFFIAPSLTILLTIGCDRFLRACFPALHMVLTGGRGLQERNGLISSS